jgi:aspartate aminotransferase
MFAKRARGLEMSGIRRMFEMAGSEAINLGLGEPDFQPPAHILEAMKEALDRGHNKYGPTSGLGDLRRVLAERHSDGADVQDENVIVTTGATEALCLTMQTFIEPGDEVLVPDPGFVLFAPHVHLAGGVPVFYPLLEEGGFLPRLEDLESLVTPRTRALVVNTPSNPTGSVMGEREVESIVEFVENRGLLLISDEVYDSIVYEKGHRTFLGRTENLVYVNSFSKVFAMTGWRLGYLIAPAEYVRTMAKVHYFMVACPPTPAQHAVLAGLKTADDFVKQMVTEFRRRRDRIVKRLNEIPGFRCLLPEGAFYAFPSYTHAVTSVDLALRLLKAGVICSPGSAFGKRGEGHLRFSYANSLEMIGRAMDIVASVSEELVGS